jgi:hypothetical protein
MPIVAGPAGFITLSNIVATPTNAGFTVTFDTDQPVLMAMDYWAQNDPSLPQPLAGSVLEGQLRMRHSITTNALPAGNHGGYTFGFSLRLDAADVSGKSLRSQQGFVRLLGGRVQQGRSVPVRFNMYGDGTRPANGGGTTSLGQGPAAGNWSSYTWAQYNPKMTTYPTP